MFDAAYGYMRFMGLSLPAVRPPGRRSCEGESVMRAFAMDSANFDALRPGVADHHARHRLSRRAFMGSAAGLAATAVGTGLMRPGVAFGARKPSSAPKPTTNVLSFNGVDFHTTFFGPGGDPSSITDFNGFVGVADVQGTGMATNPTAAPSPSSSIPTCDS